MPVAVQGKGDTVVLDDSSEHQQVPLSIFLASEQSERDRPGGIVHNSDQAHVGSSPL